MSLPFGAHAEGTIVAVFDPTEYVTVGYTPCWNQNFCASLLRSDNFKQGCNNQMVTAVEWQKQTLHSTLCVTAIKVIKPHWHQYGYQMMFYHDSLWPWNPLELKVSLWEMLLLKGSTLYTVYPCQRWLWNISTQCAKTQMQAQLKVDYSSQLTS